MKSEEINVFRQIGLWKNECPEYYDFCKKIYENRFFNDTTHSVFRAVSDSAETISETLYAGTTVFRARIVPYGMKYRKQQGFDVLNEKEIGAPPISTEGRGNPAYTSRLYVSDSPYCALSEVRPACGMSVAIGTGFTVRDLKICSFVKWPSVKPITYIGSGKKSILEALNRAFSTPVNEVKDYLPTQTISEYVRITMGFDGIAYSSSQCPDGINYLLFDTSSVKFISAQRFGVQGIKYTAFSYFPQFRSLALNNRMGMVKEKPPQSET